MIDTLDLDPMLNSMNAVGVIFEHHLLIPQGEWDSCLAAQMRVDFKEWLLEYVGWGFDYPIRGWDQELIGREVNWCWYDDRRSKIDSRKWKTQGFKMLFPNPRHATLAKLTWGGRELT